MYLIRRQDQAIQTARKPAMASTGPRIAPCAKALVSRSCQEQVFSQSASNRLAQISGWPLSTKRIPMKIGPEHRGPSHYRYGSSIRLHRSVRFEKDDTRASVFHVESRPPCVKPSFTIAGVDPGTSVVGNLDRNRMASLMRTTKKLDMIAWPISQGRQSSWGSDGRCSHEPWASES